MGNIGRKKYMELQWNVTLSDDYPIFQLKQLLAE